MATEKRLIDAKTLPYTIAVDDNGRQIFYVKAEAIDNAPTIDTVEVVRCKDCISGKGSTHKVCPLYKQGLMKDDDYCSVGERRTDAN